MKYSRKPFRHLSFRAAALAVSATACGVTQAQTVQLPTVTVEGSDQPQTAWGPVPGYVAKRSAAGTKTDTSLLETPQAISVVTREQMDQQAVQTLDQALRYVPGVTSQDNDLRFDQLTIRGFAADSYLDGLKLSNTTWFATPRIDPWFLERIDVLHGPASVLYGRASPGGVVDMVSKRPTDEPLHVIQFGIGNHDRYQTAFDFSGPVDDDGKWLYRVTGLGRDANTQTDHVQEQRIAIAPSLTWRPSADTELTLLTSYQKDPEGGLFNPVPSQGSVRWNPNGQLRTSQYLGDPDRDRFERTQVSAGYIFQHRFNSTFQFRQNLRYMQDDIDYYQSSVTGPLAPNLRNVPIWANVNREMLRQLALDNQMQADFDTGPVKHTALVGFDYQRLIQQIHRGGQLFANGVDMYNPDYSAIPRVPVTVDQTTGQTQLGAYAQDQLKLGRWGLLVGARQDWVKTDDQQKSAISGLTTASSTTSDQAFTWRGGANYTFDNGVAPYVSYTQSFQPTAGTTFDGSPFIPTRGKQYEVGVKYQPTGTNSLYTIAVYDLRQKNALTPDPDHVGRGVQTGEIRSRGIELEGRTELTPNLNLITAYSYIDQKILKANDASQGKHPVAVPVQTASAWADYTIHGGDLNGLGFGAGLRYLGKSYGSSDNAFVLPDALLVDTGVHYRIDKWRFAVNASNLFDKRYAAYCSSTSLCYWGASRAVLATAQYQW
jgi:iron complex outermembrane receptor protein